MSETLNKKIIMGSLMSRNKSVRNLEFSKIKKNTLYKAVDIIETEHGFIIKLNNGSIVGSGFRHDACYSRVKIGNTLGKALVKMGCLTEKDIEEHNNLVKERDEAQTLKYEAEYLKKILEKNSLSPTEEQKQFLNKNLKVESFL